MDAVRDSTRSSSSRRHYHYKHNELVVAEDDRDRVTRALQRRGMGVEVCNPLEGLGVCVLRLSKPGKPMPSIVRELQEAWSGSVPKIAPNHVFRLLSHTMRTVFPPRPPRGPVDFDVPSSPVQEVARPVAIALLDSGYDRTNGRLAASCEGDKEQVPDGDGALPLGVGHGTFVASKLLHEAPAARIQVRRVINDQGFVDDGTLAAAILEMAALEHVGVLHISVGSPTHDDAGALAVEDALRYVRFNRPELVVVAPAGNDGNERPIFPAASKGVIGVGAAEDVGKEWRRACFSSYGLWVDAWAPGVDVPGFFLKYKGKLELPGELPDHLLEHCGKSATQLFAMGAAEQVEDFDRIALWSGTSVAAPVVAGRIAAELLRGCDAYEAVRRVLGRSARSVPGLGTLVA